MATAVMAAATAAAAVSAPCGRHARVDGAGGRRVAAERRDGRVAAAVTAVFLLRWARGRWCWGPGGAGGVAAHCVSIKVGLLFGWLMVRRVRLKSRFVGKNVLFV